MIKSVDVKIVITIRFVLLNYLLNLHFLHQNMIELYHILLRITLENMTDDTSNCTFNIGDSYSNGLRA